MASFTTTLALAAMTLSLAFAALPARAESPATPGSTTSVVDIGVDVSGIMPTEAAVQTFLASLSPEARTALVETCQNLVAHPSDATAPDTQPFCTIAAGPLPPR